MMRSLLILSALIGPVFTEDEDPPPTPGPGGTEPGSATACYVDCVARERAELADAPLRSWAPFVQEGWPTFVVVSDKHRFVFVNNPKAASTLIRYKLRKAFRADWFAPSAAGRAKRPGRRVESTDLAWEPLRGYFRFAFVRSPLAKLQSGIDQARYNHPEAFNGSSFESIVRRLTAHGGADEHLESNLRHVVSRTRDGHTLPLHFVGRTEHFRRDWRYVVSRMANVTARQRKVLLSDEAEANRAADHGGRSGRERRADLAEEAVRRFCRTRRVDYSCLCYELPRACDQTSGSGSRPDGPP